MAMLGLGQHKRKEKKIRLVVAFFYLTRTPFYSEMRKEWGAENYWIPWGFIYKWNPTKIYREVFYAFADSFVLILPRLSLRMCLGKNFHIALKYKIMGSCHS